MKKIKNKIIFIYIALIFSAFAQSFFIFGANAKTAAAPSKAEQLYEKALKEYKAGSYYNARMNLKYILNNFKMGKKLYSGVYFLTGKVLFKEKNFFLAKPYFQRVIYKNPDYKDIYNVIYYMARCDFNLKNYRRSIRDFDFLLTKSKKGSKLYDRSLVYLTLSYASCGVVKNADKLYDKDHVKKILQKSIFLKKRSGYFKTVYLNYLINHKKNFPGALLILSIKNLFFKKKKESCFKSYYTGMIAYDEQKYAVAQNYFVKSSGYCTGYYYKNSLAYYGMSLVKQNNKKGIKYIKNASLEISYPGIEMKSLKFLASYYKTLNEPEKELKYVKRILFDSGSIRSIKGKEKTETEKKAAGLLYKIVKNDYKSKKTEKYKDAFKTFDKISFLIPSKYIIPKTYAYLAKIKLNEKNFKSALLYAKKYKNLYLNAYIYFKMKNYKKSLSFLNKINLKAIKDLKPTDKIIELKLKLYKKLNLNKNYTALLKNSINLMKPENKIRNLYYLGKNEFGENNTIKAEYYFEQILNNGFSKEKKNKNILYDVYYYLGLINYSQKKYKLSLDDFNKGYGLDASGKHFQYELSQIAYIYMKYLKNKKLALKYYYILKKNASSSTYKNLADTMISAINMQK
jgi:outer membrane protein assembly factor BamD (BamD/ComL family)